MSSKRFFALLKCLLVALVLLSACKKQDPVPSATDSQQTTAPAPTGRTGFVPRYCCGWGG